MPQGLIIRMPISQYVSCSAMFCLLHSNINKEQYEKHLCDPSSHLPMENTENLLVKCTPHISIHESQSTLISAMSNSFNNILNKE